MASNTPNLKLYMKNPATDGNDFFDVETMMNDNWEKIDGFAGSMDEVKERLNTISRQDVALQPGVQIINTAKSAPFSLSSITGRMLVNLLGRMGSCESVGLWSSNTTIATDTANKTSGTSSFKLTLGSVPATASASFLTTPGRKYIAIADVKNGNTSKVAISINGIAGATGNDVAAASAFAPSVARFAATDFFHIVTVTGTGNSGSTFNMDSVRVYEVSEADYAAAATLTPAQAAVKWPYVDSITPVRNPYAIRWTDATKTTIASMLALQTDLYADPVTGANADSVFEQGGQYFKNKNYQRQVIDGLEGWTLSPISITGAKRVEYNHNRNFTPVRQYGTKYDGRVLTRNNAPDTADNFIIASNITYIVIPNADSGWGDSYTPTADEIKAYFMGWIMYDGSLNGGAANPDTPSGNLYNGTGTKAWCRRTNGVTRSFSNPTATLPTTLAPNWTPYELVYQLATPTVEPISSEGQLTLLEGDNQVEVGTGIVLRERAKPVYESNGNYQINNNALPGSNLSNMTEKILVVYRGNVVDSRFSFISFASSYGKQMAIVTEGLYDPNASYSVTYLMLDKSPVASFVGSYAANEKTLLVDLVDSVQQNTARVSVLENKKAEKDNPTWIVPSLLNGWVSDSAVNLPAYYKDSLGVVRIRGNVKSGVVTAGTLLFKLPPGYRPSTVLRIAAYSNSVATGFGMTELIVSNTGEVLIGLNGQNNLLALGGLQFLAEQ